MMFRLLTLAILLTFMGLPPAWCQGNHLQDELNSEFKRKILLLRNFYSSNDLEYSEDGVLRTDAKEGPWTLANVEITNVTVMPNGIDIAGNRMGSWYRDIKPTFLKVGKLKIHVTKAISDADTPATLHSTLSKVFVESGEDLSSMAPDYWRFFLGGVDSKSRMVAWQASLVEDNKTPAKKPDAPSGRVSAPRAVSSPDPDYTTEASSNHIEGTSLLGIVVNRAGKATNIAVLQPLGMGLDEQAVLAVRRWMFQPATINGQPVQVQVNVQINFKCCP
jgi:TonB family protein